MVTKKPLKEGKKPFKASKVKMQFAMPLKEKKSISLKKENNKPASTAKTKVAADKLTKLPAGKSLEKETVKPVLKNLKAPVKKTPTADINGSKEVATSKKETASDKKAKATLVQENNTKPSKSSSKGAKSEEGNKPVIIPKTSTDRKVDYEPDFLKSVLDSPAVAPAGPTMRYSDAELQEFRDLISKKLDAAKKELAYLQGLITRRDEMGGDETDNRYMTMEDGGMSMEREQLSQMASRQITFTDHLEKALMRIENKTYGICRVTGKLIDKARLRAVPHATLSMEAKTGISK